MNLKPGQTNRHRHLQRKENSHKAEPIRGRVCREVVRRMTLEPFSLCICVAVQKLLLALLPALTALFFQGLFGACECNQCEKTGT